jgi:ABC-type transport system substrate-binding protein
MRYSNSGRLSKTLFIGFFIWMVFSPLAASAQTYPPGFYKSGPYVDKIVFKSFYEEEYPYVILNNELDLLPVTGDEFEMLQGAENIGTTTTRRNGYGYITINCAKYPLNITAFRRALAFAISKQAICEDAWGGMARPQDCVIPSTNPFSIEDQLLETYYEPHINLGNQLLEDAGFYVLEGEVYRRAPNGEEINIIIEGPTDNSFATKVCTMIVDAFEALHIRSEFQPGAFYEYLARVNRHGDYDIIIFGLNFNVDIDWLGYEFWSGYIDEPFRNKANFANDTYDSWRNQLLFSLSFEEVYEAAIEMQKILHYECPWIMIYENLEFAAYRTDKFEGFVQEPSRGINGWWTNHKVHLKLDEGGPFGGTFRREFKYPTSFNHLSVYDAYSWYTWSNLYDGLFRLDGSAIPIPWLAKSYMIETNEDNQHIPVGYTQITFDILQNATWSDGQELTADDVAFTLNFLREARGTSRSIGLEDVTGAYAPSKYQLVVEFDTISYWHLKNVGLKHILPKHVWSEIGPENWNTYNPRPMTDSMVTSGHFNITEHVEGEFIEMTYNPNFFYGLDRTPTSTTEPTFPIPGHQEFPFFAAALAAAVVIFIGGSIILKKG